MNVILDVVTIFSLRLKLTGRLKTAVEQRLRRTSREKTSGLNNWQGPFWVGSGSNPKGIDFYTNLSEKVQKFLLSSGYYLNKLMQSNARNRSSF